VTYSLFCAQLTRDLLAISKLLVLQGSVVQPVSTQLVNGGPVAVSSHMTSLSSNLLELDSLLDELDAVELSDDVVRHLGVGQFISVLLLSLL